MARRDAGAIWGFWVVFALLFGALYGLGKLPGQAVAEGAWTLPAFLVFLGPIWWISVLALWVMITIAIECEGGGWAATFLAAWLLLCAFVGDFNAFKWIGEHPYWFLYGLAAYVPLGIAWACWRFYLKAGDEKKEYKEFRSDWLARKGRKGHTEELPAMPADLVDAWRAYCIQQNKYVRWVGGQKILDARTYASDHKADIIRWLSWWPMSFIWWLGADFLTRVGRWIYNRISGVLQAISNHVWKGVQDDFGPPPPPTPPQSKT